jgi:chromosome segregation ATPase
MQATTLTANIKMPVISLKQLLAKDISMTKQTQIVAAKPAVDPRQRMKEIRAQVANHVNGKAVNEDLGYLAHLGDLPDNMDDARRIIIALQDMYDDRAQRHNKASEHIRDLLGQIDEIETVYERALCDAENDIMSLQSKLAFYANSHDVICSSLRQTTESLNEVNSYMELQNEEIEKLQGDITIMREATKIMLRV